jgi:hypothetical protein
MVQWSIFGIFPWVQKCILSRLCANYLIFFILKTWEEEYGSDFFPNGKFRQLWSNFESFSCFGSPPPQTNEIPGNCWNQWPVRLQKLKFLKCGRRSFFCFCRIQVAISEIVLKQMELFIFATYVPGADVIPVCLCRSKNEFFLSEKLYPYRMFFVHVCKYVI